MATSPKLRALAHPIRLRMLSLMWAEPMSAAELARVLGIGHGLATQHLRVLEKTEYVELVEVRAKRGGRERLFKAVHGLPLSEQAAEGGLPLLVESLANAARARVPAHTTERPLLAVDGELWVDPEVWKEVYDSLVTAIGRVHDAAVPAHTPGAERVSVTAIAFAMNETMSPDTPSADTPPLDGKRFPA